MIRGHEHFVEVGDGAVLHVLERTTDACARRQPRRALLMIPATLTTNSLYDAPIGSGLNVLDRAANAGYHAFAVSYEGYGKSSPAADGAAVTFQRSLVQIGRIVEWIRARCGVARVDVLGTSIGSQIAIALGGLESPIDPAHVGRIVLTAAVYKNFSDVVKQHAFTPAFEAHLRGLAGGCIRTEPAFYELVISEVQEPARGWALSTFPGSYATGPTLAAFQFPLVRASLARAPALVVWGDRDPVTPRSDVDELLAEYGAPIECLTLQGGGHSPYFEPQRERFWTETLRFLAEADTERG